MNKITKITAISILILFTLSCKKEEFDQGPIDFSYADDIAGTYIGIRTKNGPTYWGAPPGLLNLKDTITVVVEDRRTDKVCSFYIDYFDKEFMVNPSFVFINEQSNSGGGYSVGQTYYGYFNEGVLHYSQRTEYYKYPQVFYPVKLKLYKQ